MPTSSSPVVSEPDAESTARTLLAGKGVWSLESGDLQVSFDDTGKQLLVWTFEFSDRVAGSAARVEVDAITGVALVIARG